MALDTAELILAANGLFGALWLAFAGVAVTGGNLPAAGFRAALGLLFVAMGYLLYRTRKRRMEADPELT